MAMIVKQFKDQYTFLSNFYPTYLEIGGKVFPTVEHAYQAAKTTDRDWQGKIMQAQTPGQAKKIGRQAPMRADWDEIKIELMRGLSISSSLKMLNCNSSLSRQKMQS